MYFLKFLENSGLLRLRPISKKTKEKNLQEIEIKSNQINSHLTKMMTIVDDNVPLRQHDIVEPKISIIIHVDSEEFHILKFYR